MPQAERRPEGRRSGTARKWEGVELHGKTLGIVGLGRVGVLVAQRAYAFGMRLVAYDPFVSADRARQLGVAARPDARRARRDVRLRHDPRARRRPRPSGSINADVLAHAKPGLADHQRGARRHRRRRRARGRDSRRPARRRRASTCSRTSRPPSRRCSRSTASSSRRTSARRPPRRRTRRARRSPSRWCSRCAATSCRSRSTSPRPRRPRRVRPFLPLAERLGRLFTGLAGGAVEHARGRRTKVRSPTTTAACSRSRS